MNKFLYFLNKKYLPSLVVLFFVSSLVIEPLHHNEYESEHSEAECHYCVSEKLDDLLLDTSTEKLSLSIFFNSKNLDFFSPRIFKNFYSRAPPKI